LANARQANGAAQNTMSASRTTQAIGQTALAAGGAAGVGL
jgi:hypothetical protein